MSLRYYKGRFDLDKLSLRDLADATGALATLERLAANGALTFEMGASRDPGPKPETSQSKLLPRPRMQRDILAVLTEIGPASFDTLLNSTGMKDGSLSASLSALTKEGTIAKSIQRPEGSKGRPRRDETVYDLAVRGAKQV